MTADELVERVTTAMGDADAYYVSADQARAAIRVVLEEAAKACVKQGDFAASDVRDHLNDGLEREALIAAGAEEGANWCVAAIRALMPKEAGDD